MKILALLLIFFGAVTLAPVADAATVLLGPTLYVSAADSPFPVDGSNPNFFLEDFEDGTLNTPGIALRFPDLPPIAQEILGP